MSYKDEKRKIYEEQAKIYSEYKPKLEQYKINTFEMHKGVCNLFEEKTGYHIKTQQIIKKEDEHYIPYFNVFFSQNNQNWNCVEDIKVTDLNEMCGNFQLKVLLKQYIAVAQPVPTTLNELTKLKYISDFDKKLIYSNEWFANQLNQMEG